MDQWRLGDRPRWPEACLPFVEFRVAIRMDTCIRCKGVWRGIPYWRREGGASRRRAGQGSSVAARGSGLLVEEKQSKSKRGSNRLEL